MLTPLMLAAICASRECVSCLLMVGADPNTVCTEGGKECTALSCAVTSLDIPCVETLCQVTTTGTKEAIIAMATVSIELTEPMKKFVWR